MQHGVGWRASAMVSVVAGGPQRHPTGETSVEIRRSPIMLAARG